MNIVKDFTPGKTRKCFRGFYPRHSHSKQICSQSYSLKLTDTVNLIDPEVLRSVGNPVPIQVCCFYLNTAPNMASGA